MPFQQVTNKYRKSCLKTKRQLEKLQESYDALKSRRFRVRRGRNNRILYKSQLKTIYGYDSSDNQDLTHDIMDDLLVKVKDPQSSKSKKLRKQKRFQNKFD